MCRSLITALAAASIALASFSQAAAQGIYRWTDPSGRVHYSGQPPPSGTKAVQKKMGAASAPAASTLSSELESAVKNHPVTLYQAQECVAPCSEARKLLASRGVPHRVVDVDAPDKLEQLKKLSGASSVPVLVVGKTLSLGYEQQAWNSALDAAGYPRSAPRIVAPVAQSSAAKADGPGRKTDSARAVQLFVSPDCGSPCEQARSLLAKRGAQVTEISVSDPGGFSELQRVSGGTTVPVMVLGKKVLKGFEPGQYSEALDKAD